MFRRGNHGHAYPRADGHAYPRADGHAYPRADGHAELFTMRDDKRARVCLGTTT
jgi:hypothetical protein